MKSSKKQKTNGSPFVKRIIIDERLDRTRFRMLVSKLKPSVKQINLKNISIWSEEQEEIHDCNECMQLLNLETEKQIRYAVTEISGTNKEKISREDFCINMLQEGQVFLIGKFRIIGKDRHKPEKITVKQSGRNDFYRVDGIDSFREGVSKLYARCAG